LALFFEVLSLENRYACFTSMIYTRLVIVVVVYRCKVVDEMVSIKSTLDLARVHFTWLGAHRPRGWQIFFILIDPSDMTAHVCISFHDGSSTWRTPMYCLLWETGWMQRT
jgi:hypothetical protein